MNINALAFALWGVLCYTVGALVEYYLCKRRGKLDYEIEQELRDERI